MSSQKKINKKPVVTGKTKVVSAYKLEGLTKFVPQVMAPKTRKVVL